jgi:ethanolamine utilization protein EutP (predicted NTPase)
VQMASVIRYTSPDPNQGTHCDAQKTQPVRHNGKPVDTLAAWFQRRTVYQ